RLAEGASGRDVCDRIAEAIASRGAHAHSFHAGRPRHATEEPVLAFAPVETSHAAIVDWLAPLEVSARCTFEPGRRDVGTLTIACDVFNPRPIGARVRIAPALYGAGAPRSLHHDERVLGPRERISPRYEISIRPDAVTRECGCEVATASP
ncbi:MAG: hypothetical protein IT379_30585, partial [Deltaproteobacteria bacterium]|nr:hypothetical protein [Deltaproteobacteria bacterium]